MCCYLPRFQNINKTAATSLLASLISKKSHAFPGQTDQRCCLPLNNSATRNAGKGVPLPHVYGSYGLPRGLSARWAFRFHIQHLRHELSHTSAQCSSRSLRSSHRTHFSNLPQLYHAKAPRMAQIRYRGPPVPTVSRFSVPPSS